MNIIKTKLNAPEKRLSNNFTLTVDDIETVSKASEELGKALQEAIDQEVLHEIFKATVDRNKWHIVCVQYGTYQLVTKEWIEENIQGKYHCFGNYWYFEEQCDATAFALRWK